MSSDLVLKMIKVKLRDMLGAIRHNRRAIDAERRNDSAIDTRRTHLNITLIGLETPEAVHHQTRHLMDAAGHAAPRKDAVAYIEAVFSLPSDTSIDIRAYFAECTNWMASRFGCPVVSSDIHLDEAAPHCHVLVLPLKDGRMTGSRMLGYGRAFSAHLDSFYAEVGRHYGMRRSAKLKGTKKAVAVEAVIEALRKQGRLVGDDLWPIIRAHIQREPEQWVTALDIQVADTPKRLRSFTDIMISRGKGPKHEPLESDRSTAIGFVHDRQRLSCVGFSSEQIRPANRDSTTCDADTPRLPSRPQHAGTYVRQRDQDFDATLWDTERGEFAPRQSTRSALRAAIQT